MDFNCILILNASYSKIMIYIDIGSTLKSPLNIELFGRTRWESYQGLYLLTCSLLIC